MSAEFLTLTEVCKYLRISKSTIYKFAEWGKIPCLKIGKQLRFRKSSIDRFVAEKEYQRYTPPKKSGPFLPPANATKASREMKRILVVDDDELVLRALAKLLRAQGWAVDTAVNAEQALKKVEGANYDLLIADVRMPEIDGIEIIKKIRQLNKELNKPDPHEMLITGYTDSDAEKRAAEAGISECAYKPFTNSEFLDEVRKNLGLSRKNFF